MINGKFTSEEYHELGSFAAYQINKFEKGEIDVYTLVAIITLNAFDKGCQSLPVFRGVAHGK